MSIDGDYISHIIDPRTGQGLTHRIAVTVVAPTAIEADGLASAASVMGQASGMKLIEAERNAEAVLRDAGVAFQSVRIRCEHACKNNWIRPNREMRHHRFHEKPPQASVPIAEVGGFQHNKVLRGRRAPGRGG